MVPRPLTEFLLAAQVACLGAPPAPAAAPVPFVGLDFQGGSVDDDAYARAASGLVNGSRVTEAEFRTALEAIRATDRFRSVTGELADTTEGIRGRVVLDPWPPVKRLVWQGDAKRKEVWTHIRGLRTGMRLGDARLTAWSRELIQRLEENGFPQARATWSRTDGDRTLAIRVDTGAALVVRSVVVVGDPAPYTPEEIRRYSGLEAGRSLWSQTLELDTLRRLRRRFARQNRYEAQVTLAWDGQGTVRISVAPGPRVVLDSEGDRLGAGLRLADLVPLQRTERYSPEVLDEGDRRIVRSLRDKGFLDATVSHRREVTRSADHGYGEVLITYTIHKGERIKVDRVRFEGNQALGEAELRKAAALPHALLLPPGGAPSATPDLLDSLEDRIKAVYLERGYTEISVRRQLERRDGAATLVFRVREGAQHLVRRLRLELPPGGFGDPWGLGECLPLIFSDQPRLVPGPGTQRTYASDRRELGGATGALTLAGTGSGPVTMTFTLDRPLPLLKGDLTRVYNALRQQRLPALGVVRPVVRLDLEAVGADTGVRLQVPDQPTEQVRRLVVSGSDKTRARAVLREIRLKPGDPLDSEQLARAQAGLGYLGAFQRVDLSSLAEPEAAVRPAAPAGADQPGAAPAEGGAEHPPAPEGAAARGPGSPWQPGDLHLSLEERPPFVITNSFGYDKSQGYHFGVGLQQMNVGGMGRTIDYGIRAGNGTIHNPTLARMFPTGNYDRSVDSFTVAYNDPWFTPGGKVGSWLADRTQMRDEGGYIQEHKAIYLLRRRRFTSYLQWNANPRVTFNLGYRWERVDTRAALAGVSSEELAVVARYPSQTTVSAPFFQVARDTRDNAFDPTTGMYSSARLEFANQLFLTSRNSSFVKLDLRNQWTWPVGYRAGAGVVALGLRLGLARPTATSANSLPLSERFFAGGPFTFRGVEPDALGAQAYVPKRDITGQQIYNPDGSPAYYATPLGGQGLILINLEYRFPMIHKSVWGELFVDSGQVYQSLNRLSRPDPVTQPAGVPTTDTALHPPLRTALGLGLIFKVGIPLKIEYAADIKRILGKPRSQEDRDTQLKSLLISAGFTF